MLMLLLLVLVYDDGGEVSEGAGATSLQFYSRVDWCGFFVVVCAYFLSFYFFYFTDSSFQFPIALKVVR